MEGVWEDRRGLVVCRRTFLLATEQRNYLDVRWDFEMVKVGSIVDCRCMNVEGVVIDCGRRRGLRNCWSMEA